MRPYGGLECDRCGLFLQGPAPLHGTSLCGLCRRGTFSFEQARSFGYYQEPLESLIQLFKYDGFRPLARPLGQCLAKAFRRLAENRWDLVVPVPLHPKRQRERGFNQAELLAARLSRLCGLKLGTKDCVRVRNTPPQTGLRAAARRKNIAEAFYVPDTRRVQSRRLLLVDDVLTTGATVDACARVLLEAGAEAVGVVTLARTHSAGLPDRI
ncbi:MAG: ComF family protein [Acidobacteria bacterium]|nr:ComF family protein [Acidobacteriota bacterium]